MKKASRIHSFIHSLLDFNNSNSNKNYIKEKFKKKSKMQKKIIDLDEEEEDEEQHPEPKSVQAKLPNRKEIFDLTSGDENDEPKNPIEIADEDDDNIPDQQEEEAKEDDEADKKRKRPSPSPRNGNSKQKKKDPSASKKKKIIHNNNNKNDDDDDVVVEEKEQATLAEHAPPSNSDQPLIPHKIDSTDLLSKFKSTSLEWSEFYNERFAQLDQEEKKAQLQKTEKLNSLLQRAALIKSKKKSMAAQQQQEKEQQQQASTSTTTETITTITETTTTTTKTTEEKKADETDHDDDVQDPSTVVVAPIPSRKNSPPSMSRKSPSIPRTPSPALASKSSLPAKYPIWATRDYSGMRSAQALHTEILDFYNFIKPNENELKMREYVYDRLVASVRTVYPSAQFEKYGSFESGLSLATRFVLFSMFFSFSISSF